jgi:hypothetical protein
VAANKKPRPDLASVDAAPQIKRRCPEPAAWPTNPFQPAGFKRYNLLVAAEESK